MAKVSVTKPEAVKDDAPLSIEGVITDSKGRKLTIRELDFLDESDIMRLLPNDTNRDWLTCFLLPSLQIVEIDGTELDLPRTEKEIRFHLQKVGRHGVTAYFEHLNRVAELMAGTQKSQQADLKNS
jgi:hypothetical protein